MNDESTGNTVLEAKVLKKLLGAMSDEALSGSSLDLDEATQTIWEAASISERQVALNDMFDREVADLLVSIAVGEVVGFQNLLTKDRLDRILQIVENMTGDPEHSSPTHPTTSHSFGKYKRLLQM